MDDDGLVLDIEELLEDKPKKKKKVNGKQKGNRTELNLCKMLTEHFDQEFSRALGSGARTSQVNYLPEHAKKTLTGDICVPEGFKWVIECKGGYEDDMNLTNVCDGNISRLDEFIEQVTKDSEYCGRKPIILWKRNRKPWLAMIRIADSPFQDRDNGSWEVLVSRYYPSMTPTLSNFIVYKSWLILSFEELLKRTEKEFWFDEQKKNCSY